MTILAVLRQVEAAVLLGTHLAWSTVLAQLSASFHDSGCWISSTQW